MAWIESHAGLREHPKTKRLCRLLHLSRREAVGLLHFLWWWALDYVPEGDLSLVSDDDIADAVDWKRDAGDLVAALTAAGFLDRERRLHDWQDYAGRWIDRRAANAERMRHARATRRDARAPHDSRTWPEGVQLPDRTGPDHDRTGPDTTGPLPPTPPATAREGGRSLPLAGTGGHENGAAFDSTRTTTTSVRSRPLLGGRDGPAGCPAGCPTNHGGPRADRALGEDWLAIAPDDRAGWPDFLARHGRVDLADLPSPASVDAQEAP
jgi:hypothetical protein